MVVDRVGLGDRESEQAFGLLHAALEVADGVHLGKVDPDGHQGLGDLWDRPVRITLAPISREASTAWTRWLATSEVDVGRR